MNISDHVYEIDLRLAGQDRLQFYFVSSNDEKGDITKVIQYQYVMDLGGRAVFNLGFGDFDLDTRRVSDAVISNNGDPYRIFNTVLSTIPLFLMSAEMWLFWLGAVIVNRIICNNASPPAPNIAA